ncbi:MAG: hypothetical protein WCW40_00560 [Bacteroidota bacterium]
MPTGIEETVVAAAVTGTAEAGTAGVEATVVTNEAAITLATDATVNGGIEQLRDALEKLSTERINDFANKLSRAGEENIKRSQELIKNDPELFNRQKEFLDRYSSSGGHTEELCERFKTNEIQFKRRFGESFDSEEAKEIGATVKRAGKAETTIGDLHVKYPHSIKTQCLTVRDGRIIKEAYTLKPDVWYAREVKNGQKNYLMDEIKTNHLPNQLMEQKKLGFEPLTIVTNDIENDARTSPEDIIKFINSIEETGSKVIPSLPTHSVQILCLLGGLV